MTVGALIDELYGLPADEFTRARDAAVVELRREGRRAEAAQVKELRKPTAAAAAVNQLVREHRADVERFLAAAVALREAQFAGKGDLASATRAEREALDRLVRAGGENVRQSLQAAAVDEPAARQLLEGRLQRELEPRGFDALLAEAPPKARAPRTRAAAKPAPKKPDDRAARSKLREARQALAEARARERDAQRQLKRAEADRTKAEAAVTRAEDELTKVRRG